MDNCYVLYFFKRTARQPIQPTLYFINTVALCGYLSMTSLIVMSSVISSFFIPFTDSYGRYRYLPYNTSCCTMIKKMRRTGRFWIREEKKRLHIEEDPVRPSFQISTRLTCYLNKKKRSLKVLIGFVSKSIHSLLETSADSMLAYGVFRNF